MAAGTEYDTTLTSRLRAELDGLGVASEDERSRLSQLVARLEEDVRLWLSDPPRRARTLDFLRGPGPGTGKAASRAGTLAPGPLRGTLRELELLSDRLDQAGDPSDGFNVAETVAQRAHEVAHTLEGLLSAIDPSDALAAGFHRLAWLLGQLIRNAVAKMRAFAQLLGVTSFSLTFATTPPQLSVTFSFGTS